MLPFFSTSFKTNKLGLLIAYLVKLKFKTALIIIAERLESHLNEIFFMTLSLNWRLF